MPTIPAYPTSDPDNDSFAPSRQTSANRRNSKKSTGPKSADGKKAVAKNAIRHGLLSQKLILDGEDQAEYQLMLAGLMESLHPVGLIEQMLVEKVAVAMWRQQRLVRVESAAIQAQQIQHGVEFQLQARRLVDDDGLGFNDIRGVDADYAEDVEFFQKLRSDVDKARQQPEAGQWQYIQKHCPTLAEIMLEDAEDESEVMENMQTMLAENQKWADDRLQQLQAQKGRQAVLDLLAQVNSAPVSNELMHRYQAALDGELYKAITALQKQQEHRLRVLMVVA